MKTHLHSWRLAADTSSPKEQEDNSTLYSSVALPPIASTALPTQDLNVTLACVSYSARSQQARSKLCLWIREMRCEQTAAAQLPDLRLTTSNRPSNRHARQTLRNGAKALFGWCWCLSDRVAARFIFPCQIRYQKLHKFVENLILTCLECVFSSRSRIVPICFAK